MGTITEKVYIEALEKMVKEYKGGICKYCPGGNEGFVVSMRQRWCEVCDRIFNKYVEEKKHTVIISCPCHHFEKSFWEKERLVPEDYMVKVAWKMIRGWKKDNKEKL